MRNAVVLPDPVAPKIARLPSLARSIISGSCAWRVGSSTIPSATGSAPRPNEGGEIELVATSSGSGGSHGAAPRVMPADSAAFTADSMIFWASLDPVEALDAALAICAAPDRPKERAVTEAATPSG
ncbi:unannotated protein [freshwater metagenome]|uniref:Unannotated protein n=1 Tax=freshwater metagenome TaxID=449393 RepID=A0A6J6X9S7_9ZZZZ